MSFIMFILAIMSPFVVGFGILYYFFIFADLYVTDYYENKKHFVIDLIPFARFFRTIMKKYKSLK